MALVPSTLKTALIAIFVPSMTDDTFSSGLASSINTFCGTGQISASSIMGTVSAGAFTGTGTGTMVVNIASSDIKDLCDAMKSNPHQNPDGSWDPGLGEGDDYLAEQLAAVIDDACTNAQFTVLISGSAVAGQVTTPFTNVPGDVEWTGDASSLESAILNSMTDDMTDTDFADAISKAVKDYLTGAQITVKGTLALEGASGSGTMS